MKQYKSRLLTAGLAAAIIAANAVGVAFAFQGDNSVPSYQSTLPTATASVQPSATASPENQAELSEDSAVSIAKEALRIAFDLSLEQLYPVAVETEYQGKSVWFVSLIPFCNNASLESGGMFTFDCYSAYINKDNGVVLDTTKGAMAVSGGYNVIRESQNGDDAVSYTITEGDPAAGQQEGSVAVTDTTINMQDETGQGGH